MYPDQRQKETDAQTVLHESRVSRRERFGKGDEQVIPLPVGAFWLRVKSSFTLTPTNWQEQCAHPSPAQKAETVRLDEWRERRDAQRYEEDHA